MAKLNQLPRELCREILRLSDLETVLIVAQISSSFRALITQDKCIISDAWYTYPFPLPIGTTPDNPPPNMHTLAIEAIRTSERLSQAHMRKPLRPGRIVPASFPLSPLLVENLPHPYFCDCFFVFEEVVVYAPEADSVTFVIMHLTDHRKLAQIKLKQDLGLRICHLLEDNVTIRTVLMGHQSMFVDEFLLSDDHFGARKHLCELPLPDDWEWFFRDVTMHSDYIVLSQRSDLIVVNWRTRFGAQLSLGAADPVSGCVIHPYQTFLILTHSKHEHPTYISTIPLSSLQLSRFSTEEQSARPYLDLDAPITPTLRYTYPKQPEYTFESPVSHLFLHPLMSLRTSPSSPPTLGLLLIPTDRGVVTCASELISISLDDWSVIRTARPSGEWSSVVHDEQKILDAIPGHDLFHSSLVVSGDLDRFEDPDRVGEKFYALRVEREGSIHWIQLDITALQELHPNMEVGQHIVRFDMTSGRLFVVKDDKLYVMYY